MDIYKFTELTALMANIATILGFVIGIGYVYKIYNKIEINIQRKNITNIGELNISAIEKDFSKSAFLLKTFKDIKYPNKTVK